MYLSSIYSSIHLYIHISIHTSINRIHLKMVDVICTLSSNHFTHLSIPLSIYASIIHLSIHSCIYPSFYIHSSFILSIYPSICPFMHLSSLYPYIIHPSFYLSNYLFMMSVSSCLYIYSQLY